MVTRKNVLVQYRGGGYDGCIWEWNFFYLDADGKFENIFVSGCGGIETQKDAEDLLDNNGNRFSNKVYEYDLSDDKSLLEFAKETNPVSVAGIVRWFNDYNMPDAQPYGICAGCGKHINDADEICLEDWHGCGGIMSTSDTLLCLECRNMGSCGYCGEYYGEEAEELNVTVEKMESEYDLPNGVAQRVVDNWGPVCEYCVEQLLDQELDRLIAKTK